MCQAIGVSRLPAKENQIQDLNNKINDLEKSVTEVTTTTHEQAETIKHLMTVAETKIVELKLSLDRAHADMENTKDQHAQFVSQVEILKKENFVLKRPTINNTTSVTAICQPQKV